MLDVALVSPVLMGYAIEVFGDGRGAAKRLRALIGIQHDVVYVHEGIIYIDDRHIHWCVDRAVNRGMAGVLSR